MRFFSRSARGAGGLLLLLIAVLLDVHHAAALEPESGPERAVELLLRLAESGPAPQDGFSTEEVMVPAGASAVRARVYRPAAPLDRTLVVIHGVHYEGIDEPRLRRFSSEVARLGFHVVTPELSDLADYRVTPRGIDIMTATVEFVDAHGLPRPDAVGLVGISFGGGLALVAASRPEMKERLQYVASVGGHHDLSRVLRFFMENRIATPDGTIPLAAHEYGTAVLTYGALDDLAPASDVKALRIVFRQWMTGERDLARRQAGNLATPRGRQIFAWLAEGRLASLHAELEAWLSSRKAELRRVSPVGKLRSIPVPVYLLHGKTDRVIPPSEQTWAIRELQGRPHSALTTSLVEHVMPDRPASLWEKLLLVDLMGKML